MSTPHGDVISGFGTAVALGARWDGRGTHFTLFSEHAVRVELCLFTSPSTAESARIDLEQGADHVWQIHLPEVQPGQCYGYRVHGPYAPSHGHRFNPAKLLLDPYARAISGTVHWNNALSSSPLSSTNPDADLVPDLNDSAPVLPKCIVVDSAFDWGSDRPPATPWESTLIYECHVKGMTMLHPEVPEHLRGTYMGLSSDPILDHLRGLGITAVELLPVHHMASEHRLAALGLTNYWGYSSIGYFAPDARYASGGQGEQVTEFKSMVRRFHEANIEVILDVVYNHTAEGNHLGPTLSFRGIDNTTYYRPHADGRRHYADYTGCGNTVDLRHPRTRQLVLDSLRYWVTDMHVDGFRFDIAPVLARDEIGVNMSGEFMTSVRQDPVLSRVKLIAEPWDLGPGGYQTGHFPPGWSEWNDKYRNTVRGFWRGDQNLVGELAARMTGSGDLYHTSGRTPQASVNFVTCHDGFTLHDLVSYEAKHNLSNGEQNRDGSDYNLSRNWGVEGPTDAVRTLHMRERMKRNFLATLAFSQGVPMLSHGDELGRTQSGNNNAYCHDSPLTWVDWTTTPAQQELLRFTREVFAIRAATPVLRRGAFFSSGPNPESGLKELTWLTSEGKEMSDSDWRDPGNHVLGMLLRSQRGVSDQTGTSRAGADALLLLLNAGGRSRSFALPPMQYPGMWTEVVHTAHPVSRATREGQVPLGARCLILLRYQPAS